MKYLLIATLLTFVSIAAHAETEVVEKSCQPMLKGKPVGDRIMASDMTGLARLATKLGLHDRKMTTKESSGMVLAEPPALTCVD